MATRRDIGMQKDEELVESFERELEGAPEGGSAAFVASGKFLATPDGDEPDASAEGWPEPYCASGKMHSP